jgi:hypothetical protein
MSKNAKNGEERILAGDNVNGPTALRLRRYWIGDGTPGTGWNMDLNATYNIPHFLSVTELDNVRLIQVYITDDSQTKGNIASDLVDVISNNRMGIDFYDNTNIVLRRITGGDYDNVNYNDPNIIRGYVTILYKPDI